jgi:hypothetical protein
VFPHKELLNIVPVLAQSFAVSCRWPYVVLTIQFSYLTGWTAGLGCGAPADII